MLRRVLNDLIGETEATKEAIESAQQGLDSSAYQVTPPQQQAPAPAAFEADLFGFGGGAPAPAPMPTMAPAPSYGAPSEAQYGQQAGAPAPFPATGQFAPPDPVSFGGGVGAVETVSDDSSAEQDNDGGDDREADAEPMFDYNGVGPGAVPNIQGQDSMAPPPQSFQAQRAMAPQSQTLQYGQPQPSQANPPFQGANYEQPFKGNQMAHNRHSSISSQLSFEVMGGGPAPQNQLAQPDNGNNEDSSDDGYNQDINPAPAPSMNEINDLLSQAKIAEELAQESEATLRTMMNKADKLRRAADQAEVEARQKAAEASEKKSGMLKGGKKKKSMVSDRELRFYLARYLCLTKMRGNLV